MIVDFSGMSGKIGLLAVQGRSYCDLRTNPAVTIRIVVLLDLLVLRLPKKELSLSGTLFCLLSFLKGCRLQVHFVQRGGQWKYVFETLGCLCR